LIIGTNNPESAAQDTENEFSRIKLSGIPATRELIKGWGYRWSFQDNEKPVKNNIK